MDPLPGAVGSPQLTGGKRLKSNLFIIRDSVYAMTIYRIYELQSLDTMHIQTPLYKPTSAETRQGMGVVLA